MSNREVSFICIENAAAAAPRVAITAAVSTAAVLLLLPLFVIVRPMAKFVAGSLNLIPVFLSIHSKTIYLPFSMCLMAVLSHLRPRFA